MGEFYKMLTKGQNLEEGVIVNPLDSFETIISAVNHALEASAEIGVLIADEQQEQLKECNGCGGEVGEMPVLYPILIATFPAFCLFELGDDTYRVSYTYDNKTRRVTLGTPEEVALDINISTLPEEPEE